MLNQSLSVHSETHTAPRTVVVLGKNFLPSLCFLLEYSYYWRDYRYTVYRQKFPCRFDGWMKQGLLITVLLVTGIHRGLVVV